MSAHSGTIAAALFALILACSSAMADTKAIQGTLLGKDGKPVAGADIRADRLDAKAEPAKTKTDAQGRYVFKVLPVGAYKITVIVKEVPKMHAEVRTRTDGWAKVDFDLRTPANGTTTKKRVVWVPGEPGSHIGGRWMEIDQANMPSASAVDNIGTDDVNRINRSMQINSNASAPGR
jgi:Carboxypeptidase regulatory-like domain